ncbi:DUF6493 family protein [[Pseudopropionibacterium] massiliense]|uniref:DUF7824 domain-containing protein n=1 Tax=[Pseudopropionibacterium] massiliense TaxID=2220000 RepID=UPI001032551B|nr:DUF6493 family protein [[Pseudopropionibacterium] massiliense]
MAERSLTPEELALERIVNRSRTTGDLLDELGRLSPEQRALAKKSLPVLRSRAPFGLEYRCVVLAAFLNTTPTQMVATLTEWSIRQLANDRPAHDYVVERVAAHDEKWARRFVAATLKKTSLAEHLPPLLDPLINTFDLPLPTDSRYWSGWMRNHSAPTPHCRWEKRFIAACSAPNAFVVRRGDRTTYLNRITRDIHDLRAIEPTDDPALLRALLQIFARGDRDNAQRVAMLWLKGLGLIPLLPTERNHVFKAMPRAGGSFVRLAVKQLLSTDLTDTELTDLALTVLPHPQKALRRAMMKAVSRLITPSQDLLDAVRLIATQQDTTSAALAKQLLEHWDRSADGTPEEPPPGSTSSIADHSETRTRKPGLWRTPAGRCPQPLRSLSGTTLVLNDPDLETLIVKLDADRRGNPGLQEHALAALVATAHVRGPNRVRHAIRTSIRYINSHRSLLARLLQRLGRRAEGEPRRPVTSESKPLTFLPVQRAIDVLSRLGELPCLLSTPTHTDFHIAWNVFAGRARHYRHTGVKVLPTDIAVALARLDRSTTPEDLSAFEQPIHGVTADLATVIDHWRNNPARPGELRFLPAPEKKNGVASAMRVEVDGDEPTVHELLGIRSHWALPYRPVHPCQEDPWVLVTLPEHPTRPAGLALQASGTFALNIFEHLVATAPRFGPVASFVSLILASDATEKERDRTAALILTAWDEERLTPDDLVAAWNSPWRRSWKISVPRITTTLGRIADAGGLALVWPLLTGIAEEIAGQDVIPAPDSTVLEAVLHHLPEVQAAGVTVDLPNATALATRTVSLKAVKIAQLIVQAL